MGVEDNALAKILQEEEDLWAAHELASTDKRHWNPASTNNTSGLLTGPEYSSDDIGDGPPVDDADLDELSRRVASNDVRVSAIGHNLVAHEQEAAFEALSDRPSPTALHIMDDGGRDEDEHLAHHLASLDKRPDNPSSFDQPLSAASNGTCKPWLNLRGRDLSILESGNAIFKEEPGIVNLVAVSPPASFRRAARA